MTMMFTARHYKFVAEILLQAHHQAEAEGTQAVAQVHNLTHAFAQKFGEDNERFDKVAFMAAASPELDPWPDDEDPPEAYAGESPLDNFHREDR